MQDSLLMCFIIKFLLVGSGGLFIIYQFVRNCSASGCVTPSHQSWRERVLEIVQVREAFGTGLPTCRALGEVVSPKMSLVNS